MLGPLVSSFHTGPTPRLSWLGKGVVTVTRYARGGDAGQEAKSLESLDAGTLGPHRRTLATYHSWMALPFTPSTVQGPMHLPGYLNSDLWKHVLRNVAQFGLRAHTLRIKEDVSKLVGS